MSLREMVPTTYFEDREGPTGYEYELVRFFADSLDVELRLQVVKSLDEAYSILEQNYTHIAALGLSRDAAENQSESLRFSSQYIEFQPVVVFKNGNKKPSSLEDLVGKSIAIPSQTAQAKLLETLKQFEYPNLRWHEYEGIETPELMRMVADGEVELAIVNSIDFDVHKAIFPAGPASLSNK